jgi:hypothetical protein
VELAVGLVVVVGLMLALAVETRNTQNLLRGEQCGVGAVMSGVDRAIGWCVIWGSTRCS